ncbi:hypothetical protein ABN034_33505 [Actinopolymorpha sp. B11F2]|uniref:hypothetical protein n=1 Tax=Actinopolymorpha sp. B11F2 TaxID=3160862 RepID=UPI0032E3BB9E
MLSDGGDGLSAGLSCARDGENVVDGGWASTFAALGLGGAEPVGGAFADEFACHLGGHRGDREQHLVGDGGAVGAVQSGADAGEDCWLGIRNAIKMFGRG